MKGLVLQENLKKTLLLIERIAGKNTQLPILENVLMKADKNNIQCVCTDLEVAIEAYCPAKIEIPGIVCVPIRPLSGFISNIPNEKITMELKNNFLNNSTKKFFASIKTFSPQEFPLIPKIKKDTSLQIDEEKFAYALQSVVGISSISDLKPEITGVCIVCERNKIKCAATDSFRLAEKTIPCVNQVKEKTSFILPLKTIQELIHILQGRKGTIEIFVEPNQVLIEEIKTDEKNPKFRVISRVIEGEFPQYEQIIPQKYKTQIQFVKNDFISVIKAASLFSSKIHEVTLLFQPTKKTYTISTENAELGKQTAMLEGQGSGEDAEIVFNWKFLLDGLQRIESSEIFFGSSGQAGPSVIKPVGDASYLYVLMPIKNT